MKFSLHFESHHLVCHSNKASTKDGAETITPLSSWGRVLKGMMWLVIEFEVILFLHRAVFHKKGGNFKHLMARMLMADRDCKFHTRRKTSDVNNKRMVCLEDYDRIIEVII